MLKFSAKKFEKIMKNSGYGSVLDLKKDLVEYVPTASSSLIYNWISKGSIPSGKYVIPLCELLNAEWDDFLVEMSKTEVKKALRTPKRKKMEKDIKAAKVVQNLNDQLKEMKDILSEIKKGGLKKKVAVRKKK